MGAGGIGMSALARYLMQMHANVYGYDRTRTTLCADLEQEGIIINYDDTLRAIPEVVKNPSQTLVIYTPAIPANSEQLNFFKSTGFTMLKRSKVLGLITENSFNISVAGTHGKTTTSSLVSHILNEGKIPFAAFLGGISANLGSNYYNTNTENSQTVTVTEADEFDRSFLTLSPNVAVVTSMDPDHLDIYGDKDAFKASFFDFINKIEPNGLLLLRHGLDYPAVNQISVKTYGINQGDYQAINLRIEDGWFVFDFKTDNALWTGLKMGIPGIHNIENAVAAIAVGLKMGLNEQQLRQSLESFIGVKRRFEFIIRTPKQVYIDDYAHHPSELEAFIKSVKMLYPNQQIAGIFQPHLYTRTRDFAEGFSKSLSLLDTAILLDIYPARELPIPGVNSEMLFENISSPNKYLSKKETVLDLLKTLDTPILLTMGAGDIDTLVPQIKAALS